MKKKTTIIFILIFFALLLFYTKPAWELLFSDRSDGFYEPITGILYCRSELYCWHERGHKIDDEHGWISRTDEFKQALEKYSKTYNGNRVKEYADYIMSSNSYYKIYSYFGYYQEIYAIIYQVHGGRIEWMPEYLQEFYLE